MKLTLVLFALLLATPTYAHEVTSDLHDIDLTMDVFRKAVEWTPEILEDSGGVATPFLKVSGQTIYLNSPFWNLVRAWVRLYHSEIQRDCPACLFPSEDVLLEEAKDLAAQGFFKTKIANPLGHSIEHITLETADLGARLGHTALVAKVASEVAETIGSKFAGGAGVHIFCNAIDAVIIFGTRNIQTLIRIPTWSHQMGLSSTITSLKYFAASRAIRRAQKKVRFETEPFEVSDEELQQVDAEGSNRWWGFIERGKRDKFIKLIQAKGSKVKISQKEFMGTRYKRFLFLKARKRGKPKFLNGSTPIDQALGKNILWIASVQENILNRALIPKDPNSQSKLVQDWKTNNQNDPGISDSSVIAGLADEMNRPDMKEILSEIAEIYDPSRPSSERYLKVLMVENALGGFLYQMLKWKLNEVELSHSGYWSGMWESARLRWAFGKYVKYVFEYGDFLRVSASTKNEEFLTQKKYEALETFTRLLKHLQATAELLDQNATANDMTGRMKEMNSQLWTFRPWKEKRTHYSWIPILPLKPPTCESLSHLESH